MTVMDIKTNPISAVLTRKSFVNAGPYEKCCMGHLGYTAALPCQSIGTATLDLIYVPASLGPQGYI